MHICIHAARHLRGEPGMTGDGLEDYYCAPATYREPLLRGHPGNARRRASLEEIRNCLEAKIGTGHSLPLRFLGLMGPDSTLSAWAILHRHLKEIDPGLARTAATEHALARSEIWGAMKTGADMIPHLDPIHSRFYHRRSEALSQMCQELTEALGHAGKPVLLDSEMRAHIVDMARFGSEMDDDATRMVVEKVYIYRDKLEEACDICEEILGFRSFDFHRMAGSTLFEDIMLEVLTGLHNRDEQDADLVSRCQSLLERRSDMLGLGIRPKHGDNNAPRALLEFAFNISTRAGILPAEELNRHILEHYPKSHRFLGLDRASNLQKMVTKKSPLASTLSVFAGGQELTATIKVPYAGGNALMPLEIILGELDMADASPSALKKWRAGILAEQLWENLFEMEMYLRLRKSGASVTVDRRVGGKVVDLEFNGVYAEIYSPLAKQFVSLVDDPSLDFIGDVLAKSQMGSVGKSETIMIVDCPPAMFADVLGHEHRATSLLGQSCQPGGVFFVLGMCYPQRLYKFLPNPRAITPVSDVTIGLVSRALDVDLQPPRP